MPYSYIFPHALVYTNWMHEVCWLIYYLQYSTIAVCTQTRTCFLDYVNMVIFVG